MNPERSLGASPGVAPIGTPGASPAAGIAESDYTIEIRLKKPYPQLVYTLAQGYSAIVPREAVEKYGQMLASHPVGSGPFMLKSRDSVRVVMVKNPDFREELEQAAKERKLLP